MENKKSDLTNPVFANDARTENSSGLSSVIEEMDNGIDIQPLEDMEKSEMIEFEDRSGMESDDDEDASVDKKQTVGKRVLKIMLTLVAIAVVIFGGYTAYLRLNDFSHAATAVYQKGSDYYISLDNDKKIEIDGIIKAQLSTDGSVLVYSQDTSSKTGKYDIRMIELKKRRSASSGGTLIVSGIESEWSTNSDCSYIYYTETQGKDTHYFAYSVAARATYNITYDASEVFLPPKGDIVYFIRDHSNESQLYRIRLGEKAELIETVSAARGFTDDSKLEVIYTVSSGEQTYDLYKISGIADAEKIAENISEVYLDDYKVGGNLYYFIKSASKLNWTDFVDDSYADSDAVMSKPDKGEYLVTRGFFLKRTTVDETAYNQAVEKYEKKLVRDEIREALDDLDLGLALSSEYKIKVYDGEKSKELAGGVKLENIVDFSKDGTPSIIFKKTGIDSSKKIKMEELYQLAKNGGAQYAIDHVLQTLRGDYEVTSGYRFSRYNGTNVFEYEFKPKYDVSSATFLFTGRGGIYAAVKAEDEVHCNLYYSEVGDKEIKAEKEVAQGVTTYESSGNKIFVSVAQSDEHNTLYAFYPDGTHKKIADNCVQYFENDKKSKIIALTADKDQDTLQTVDIVIYENNETENIDSNVDYRYFIVKNDRFAYIKDYQITAATEAEIQSGGEMKIYNGEKVKTIDANVTEIVDFN